MNGTSHLPIFCINIGSIFKIGIQSNDPSEISRSITVHSLSEYLKLDTRIITNQTIEIMWVEYFLWAYYRIVSSDHFSGGVGCSFEQ